MDALASKPRTVGTAIDMLSQLHGCVEGLRGEVGDLKDDVGDLKGTIDDIRDRVGRLEGGQEAMARGFSLPTPAQMADAGGAPGKPEVHRKLGGMNQKEAVWVLMGAFGSLDLLFRVIWSAGPGIWHAVTQALLTTH